MGIPSPTGRSSRSPRRTSARARGRPPTRSTASPRCSSTCCATSSPRTWRCASTSHAQTFRSERYTEYKANRTTTPDDFRGQVDLIKEVLRALAIPEFGVAGFEADDLIATLATQAEVDGFQVLITSGDRDAFQLVSDNVTVLYPTRGVSELGRIDPDAVMARYGLTPAQYPDFAALRGDPSDNLPSIPGVGEKTAAKWVREFGSLAELTDRVDEVKGKAGDALRAHLAGVVLNRQLTELVRDVPLDARPEDLAVRPWDRDAVHRLFDELEFRVLRERLFATLQSAEPEAEGGIEVQGGAIPAGGLRAWLDEHARDGRRVGLAFHGVVGTAAAADLTGIGLATGEPSVEARAAGAAAGLPQAGYVEVAALTPDDEAALGEWLADPAVPKAAHDAKAAMHALRGRGWSLVGLTSDTALAAYLTRPGQRSFDLADLALRYLRRELRQGGEDEGGQLSLLGGEEEAEAERATTQMVAASAVAELADALDAELAEKAGSELLAELELPLRVRAGRSGDGGHRRRPRPAVLARGRVRGAGEAGRAGRLLGDRQGDQPRLAEAAAGRAVRRAEHAQDQAHQDRLHHRCRCAADPLRADRARVPLPPARPPRRHPAQDHRRGPAEVHRRRRADPHHLQPDHRGHGAAVVHRAQPAERADPHGGRAAHPRDVHRRAGLRRADDRGLQPDRDADHGAPLGGRGAHRGVPLAARFPRRDRRPRVRASIPPRSAPPSAPRSRR